MIRSGAHISRGVKINYNSACDLDKLERFKASMFNFASVKKLTKLMALIIKDIPTLIPCEGVGVFVS